MPIARFHTGAVSASTPTPTPTPTLACVEPSPTSPRESPRGSAAHSDPRERNAADPDPDPDRFRLAPSPGCEPPARDSSESFAAGGPRPLPPDPTPWSSSAGPSTTAPAASPRRAAARTLPRAAARRFTFADPAALPTHHRTRDTGSSGRAAHAHGSLLAMIRVPPDLSATPGTAGSAEVNAAVDPAPRRLETTPAETPQPPPPPPGLADSAPTLPLPLTPPPAEAGCGGLSVSVDPATRWRAPRPPRADPNSPPRADPNSPPRADPNSPPRADPNSPPRADPNSPPMIPSLPRVPQSSGNEAEAGGDDTDSVGNSSSSRSAGSPPGPLSPRPWRLHQPSHPPARDPPSRAAEVGRDDYPCSHPGVGDCDIPRGWHGADGPPRGAHAQPAALAPAAAQPPTGGLLEPKAGAGGFGGGKVSAAGHVTDCGSEWSDPPRSPPNAQRSFCKDLVPHKPRGPKAASPPSAAGCAHASAGPDARPAPALWSNSSASALAAVMAAGASLACPSCNGAVKAAPPQHHITETCCRPLGFSRLCRTLIRWAALKCLRVTV
jgi:hypothetical protein